MEGQLVSIPDPWVRNEFGLGRICVTKGRKNLN